MYVEITAKKSADVRRGVVGELGFQGVEVFGTVVWRTIKDPKKERSRGCVNGEPDSFGRG